MLNKRLTLLVVSFIGFTALALVAQQADTVINPLANDPAAAGAGQHTFAATCQACHGAGAQGDRERGAPALTARGFKHGDGDGDIFRTIRSGVPGTQMPPVRGAERSADLAARLRTSAACSWPRQRRASRLPDPPRPAATPPRAKRCSSAPRRTAPPVMKSTAAAVSSGRTCRMPAGSTRRSSARRSPRPAPRFRAAAVAVAAPPPRSS